MSCKPPFIDGDEIVMIAFFIFLIAVVFFTSQG